MKFDFHCHTQEGSLDGKIAIFDYIKALKEKGYQGMLVTDHNSYNGFRKYRDEIKKEIKDFIVLKGIEYDTIDAGHILVVLPEDIKLKIMEYRGLPVRLLQDIVHKHGGILGPAHPCGERHLSITQTRIYKKHPEIMKKFDFLEGFNSCESEESNAKAIELAKKYNLPTFGGSDSHSIDCVGSAFTEIDKIINKESDLIKFVKEKCAFNTGGYNYKGTIKEKLGLLNHILVESFWFYNRLSSLYRSRKRRLALKLLNQHG